MINLYDALVNCDTTQFNSIAVTCNALNPNAPRPQSQTLKHVGIYLPEPVCSHGQLYVAFSRVKDPRNLKVFIDGKKDITNNVVYKEIL